MHNFRIPLNEISETQEENTPDTPFHMSNIGPSEFNNEPKGQIGQSEGKVGSIETSEFVIQIPASNLNPLSSDGVRLGRYGKIVTEGFERNCGPNSKNEQTGQSELKAESIRTSELKIQSVRSNLNPLSSDTVRLGVLGKIVPSDSDTDRV